MTTTDQNPAIIAQVTKTDLHKDGTTETTDSYTIASVDGYTVPIDPMDDLACDSCQAVSAGRRNTPSIWSVAHACKPSSQGSSVPLLGVDSGGVFVVDGV